VTVRVLIAEDMDLIRAALVALLSKEADLDVVAELARGDAVLSTALRLVPDVAVLDIDLPGLDGVAVAEALHAELPTCKTLIVTGFGQPGNLLRALCAHVRGFVPKDAPGTNLADAIRRVARGERVFDPDLVAAAIETGESPLRSREADVLRAAEAGLST
jgi:two-component system, NarL family, response regulator DesR